MSELDPATTLADIFAAALYTPAVTFQSTSPQVGTWARPLRTHSGVFDVYCPGCGKHATYRYAPDSDVLQADARLRKGMGGDGDVGLFATFPFRITARCTRNASHSVEQWVRLSSKTAGKNFEGDTLYDRSLSKIGQHPSLTDFQLGDLGEFESAMTKTQRREFVQAINSAAHGYSVAACTYLRRVFEQLLKEARDAHIAEHGLKDWPEFRAAKTDERIKLVRDRLPAFLSEHPQLYGLLSLGVHELSDEECAREFPLLRQAIELIFTEKANAARREKARLAAQKLIDQAGDRYKDRAD
ncbi:hypothetical protein [Aquabacterium humicola]|uniref:hypothetical protein n=1 Tax=Aquabacterium humicola TaxID=3237377 RepID=UPI0025426F1E|nr:hypothetical protein [Rubrivivax pictus]